jgi:hypothetical protein
MKRECGNCEYFEKQKTLPSGALEGACVRFPPSVVPTTVGDSFFPSVISKFTWCGEFKARQEELSQEEVRARWDHFIQHDEDLKYQEGPVQDIRNSIEPEDEP